LATRVVELDRGQLMSFPGSYATFEARKAGALEAEEKAFAEQDKKLAQEEAWIRRGIKARGVRNMGRVRALEKLRAERRRRRERQGKAKVVIQEADRSGTLVLRAEQLAVGYGDGPDVVTDFSTIILRGDRVGIVGPNGCGKTTLLRTLLGEIAPRRGQCRQGSNLEVAYFDQLRGQLDGDTTVADSVSGGPDWVMQGERRRHVIGYLEDFLFTPDRARSPVKALSGGERNRLLLAKLFLKPSNVMVLDEPTNDLDVETLELLEERLGTYGGTVLVVSHDREFVDNVVTSTIAYVEGGVFTEHAGGYSDWLEQERAADKRTVETARPSETRPASEATVSAGAKKGRPRTEKPRKLSFKEKRELESLPQTIEALEAEQSTLHAKMADPGFYKGGPEEVATATARLASIETELARAYERWEALEAIAQGE
ncbi:MAG: ATP-binding cassette domain-containing protein, partial [Myxococcota bacterium]